MLKKIIITFILILIFLLIFVTYFSLYGIKTDSFNSFIDSKVKEYNPQLSIKLGDVFIKLNIPEYSVVINTKNAIFNLESNPVKISNININLNIYNFIKRENSIKSIKLQSKKNSIKNLTYLLNTINYNLTRYKFYSQIEEGLIDFQLDIQSNSSNKKNFDYRVFGNIKDAKLNLNGFDTLDKINFDFDTKDNLTRITNSNLKYQNINFYSKKFEILKEKDGILSIYGEFKNDKTLVNPNLLIKLANLKQNYLSKKDIALQTKNEFSFNLNTKYKIKNFKINSIINFDEIYFNNNFQKIIFLKNGKINSKYEKNQLFADLSSNFSFIDEDNLNHDYKSNNLDISIKKRNNENFQVYGSISNEKKQINTKVLVDLFKLDSELISDESINIGSNSEFKLNFDKKNELKEYLVSSKIKIDKLTSNKYLKRLIFLRNVESDLSIQNGLLNLDLKSNYSFFKKEYNSDDDNNLITLKLDKINKKNSNVEIFLNTKNNSINTKEIKNLFDIETNFLKDQIVKLNSNFFINFSINKKNKIKNLKLKSDLYFDNLTLNYQSNFIKKYLKNYQNKIIFKKPKILIKYSNNKFNLQLDGKYALKDKNNNIFIKANGNKKNFEIYSSLNLNDSIINLSEIEYFKKEDVVSNLEFSLNYNHKKPIFKKVSFTENDNKFLLENLYLSKDLKIIKVDHLDMNFINKNKVLNNLNLKKISNKYKISGNNYDVENLLEQLLKKNNSNKLSKIFVNLNTSFIFDFKKLYLEKNSYLHKFSGEIDIKNNQLFLAKLFAETKKNNKFSYSFRTTAKDEKITNIEIHRPRPFINNYKFIKGFEEGILKLNSTKIDNISRSNLKIKDFKVKEVPVLAKILTLASLQGIADLLTGEGIRFDEFEMDFKTKNNLIEIDEMYAIGPAVSIMMEGYVEKDKIVSLRGTLVPATTINKTISKIPLLGDILVGNKIGEGVFGVSFKIKGPPNELKSTVNPIKTLTPRFITRTLENLKGN